MQGGRADGAAACQLCMLPPASREECRQHTFSIDRGEGRETSRVTMTVIHHCRASERRQGEVWRQRRLVPGAACFLPGAATWCVSLGLRC